jgi:hypothetical protein
MFRPQQALVLKIRPPTATDDPLSGRSDPLRRAQPATIAAARDVATAPAGRRCATRGCVFPALELSAGLCRIHLLQSEEPELFQSCQPILRVLLLARYNVTGLELADYRAQQHLVQAAVREAFLRGVA